MNPSAHETRWCRYCGREFVAKTSRQVTCGSETCKRKHENWCKSATARKRLEAESRVARARRSAWWDVLKIMGETGLQYVDAVKELERRRGA